MLLHLRLLYNYRQLTPDLTVIQTTLDTLTNKVDDLESDISEQVQRTGVVEGTLLTTTSSLTGKQRDLSKGSFNLYLYCIHSFLNNLKYEQFSMIQSEMFPT